LPNASEVGLGLAFEFLPSGYFSSALSQSMCQHIFVDSTILVVEDHVVLAGAFLLELHLELTIQEIGEVLGSFSTEVVYTVQATYNNTNKYI